MPCFHPLDAHRPLGAVGGRLSFGKPPAGAYRCFKVPCGQCVGCRLERSRQWAARCVHEASLYDANCFVTLTYSDDFLPQGGTLVLRDLQLFMKRLRKRFGSKIRFYACGEYGDLSRRPHYHLCLFNFRPDDLVLFKRSKSGDSLFISDALSRVWPFGHVIVGDLTFDSAAYVARYVMKKLNGDAAEGRYQSVDPVTGDVFELAREFNVMSRRPGIGAGWFAKFKDDVYPSDSVVVNGRECRPPRFYDKSLSREDADLLVALKEKRVINARPYRADNTPARLLVRERVVLGALDQLKREL